MQARDVHGDGNHWDPVGPMGFPTEMLMGTGMGKNSREWEGMGIKILFTHTSSASYTRSRLKLEDDRPTTDRYIVSKAPP